MHLKWHAPLIVTLLALCGCTREPEQPVAPPAAADQTPRRVAVPDARPVIAVLGDSIAEGLGVAEGKSFPDQLQGRLDKEGYRYRVVNFGVSGDTTSGGLGRLPAALDLKPAIVILELGGNDGLRGVPVASTRANLDQMVRLAKKSGADVLLAGMTLPANYGTQYIAQFEKLYKDVADSHRVRLIPFLMEEIRRQYGAHPDLMQRDGIHPSAQGHTLIADTVYQALLPMLHKT